MKLSRLSLFFLLLPFTLQAELEVSSFFGDHMVLQRDQPLPVWGKATPGDKVTVSFRDSSVTTQSGENGKWMAELPQQSVGEAASLQISSGDRTVVFQDILVGEVWICSGQSNMEWPVENSENADSEIAAANYPNIRLLDIPRTYSPDPVDEIDASWQVCSPESIPSFSAVAYFFGRELWNEIDVPIGLVSTSWGGTRAEAWTPLETLKANPDYDSIVASYYEMTQVLVNEPELEQTMQSKYDSFMNDVLALANSPPPPDPSWFELNPPVSDMQPVEPDTNILGETDGMVYVRNVFSLEPTQASRKGARIRLGQIDNYDATWINGVKIGHTLHDTKDARRLFRDYEIPNGTLKPGKNVILIQIVDVYRDSHFGKNIDQLEVYWPSGIPVALHDNWKMEIMVDLGTRPETLERKLKHAGSVLFNGMIAPITQAAFQGVIWYQGESNASRAAQYRTLFPDMIEAWRDTWNRGSFPFYFVQLANYRDRNPEPEEHNWAELREAQRETLALPNTGMAVTIDIGEAEDIHPRNKQDVGKRLALLALANTYNIRQSNKESIPHSGPLFREALIEDGQIRIYFDHVNGGLRTSDGEKLKGFAIAEENGPFQWAEARVEGNEVVVSHPEMDAPKEVRYAWATNPEVNFINGAGLPASPFRTDTRPWTTEE